jgi:Na+(H+)/acetate symporter ActP
MFPHMSIMCFTARKVTAFKKTVVLYPLCIAAIWLPCCFLGSLGPGQEKVRDAVASKSEQFQEWYKNGTENEKHDPAITDLNNALHAAASVTVSAKTPVPVKKAKAMAMAVLEGVERHSMSAADAIHNLYAIPDGKVKVAWNKVATHDSDSVLLEMLKVYVPAALAGLLAAGIISAVMGSDCHQILGLSTMFTKDIFTYYGGGRVSERSTVVMGRAFILIANGIAYVIALGRPPIFELAVTYAFSGFAALSPMMIAALFWKRSNKWAALANTLWVAGWVLFMVYAEQHYKPNQAIIGNLMFLNPAGKLTLGAGFTPVVPMTLGAALLVWIVSLITPPPTRATIEKYFPQSPESAAPPLASPVTA